MSLKSSAGRGAEQVRPPDTHPSRSQKTQSSCGSPRPQDANACNGSLFFNSKKWFIPPNVPRLPTMTVPGKTQGRGEEGVS